MRKVVIDENGMKTMKEYRNISGQLKPDPKTLPRPPEVDGYAFHVNNPKQLERDKMKDNILQKYGIPILRIKTNESGEEMRLRNKLIEILN